MSKLVSVYDFLDRQDLKIYRKVSNAKGHPLSCVKPSSYCKRGYKLKEHLTTVGQ